VELSISDGALSAIAHAAVRERSGARGLRRVIDRVLSDPLFVASDRPSVSKCVVDAAAVVGEESPKLFDEKGVPINLRRNRVFLSYSRADQAALNELQIVMAPLVRRKTIDVWFDGDIKPSQKWREEVRTAMASTKVAVLLVSPNFLASRFVVEEELPYFLKVADEEDVKIVWLLLSSCLYEETELRDYQAAHNISRPLDTLSEAERRAVWVEICKNIKLAAEMNSI
jgi:hypothetical protein